MTPKTLTNRFDLKNDSFPSAVVILAFFLPIVKYGIQIPFLLFILSWILYPKVSFKKVWWPFLIFAGFYIFHLFGLRNTTHIDLAIPDLVQKLSLLLFPFFFALARPLSRRFRRMTLIAFALGTVVSVILSFAISFSQYAHTGDLSVFYMSEFSPFFHPSYVAMYINLAIAILLTVITVFKFNRIQFYGLWVCILFLSLTLVFPTSKMGFITFALLIGFFLFKWATQRVFFKLNTLLLVVIGFATMLFIRYDPIAQSRINSAVAYVDGEKKPQESSQIESNAARIYAWKAALAEIREHPLGVGTGDINVDLQEHFRKEGLDALADKDLNPHNQYLQSAMALGIPAVLWLLFSLLYPFGKIIKTKNWLYAFFICLFAVNITVESMLEKQSGIIFFAFLNAFFYFTPIARAEPDIDSGTEVTPGNTHR